MTERPVPTPVPELLRAAELMDQLRSPGGCPWDAEQTHASLAKYLLEETYETLDAIEDGDAVALREELGDLLLQVLFHARLAEEAAAGQRFSIEDVAADLVAKLTRRHPHVFGRTTVSGAAEVNANWEVIKQQEKQRSSVTEGVPMGQPALALAAKLIARADKLELTDELAPAAVHDAAADFGPRLFELARQAVRAGVDPELALRSTARSFADAVKAREVATVATSAAADQVESAIERSVGE
jgi:XTP/dITP diphosphohydrolase